MQNAERRMHCLFAASFTCVCLRLAFICWKGPNTPKCCPLVYFVFCSRKFTLAMFQQSIRNSCPNERESLSLSSTSKRTRKRVYPIPLSACPKPRWRLHRKDTCKDNNLFLFNNYFKLNINEVHFGSCAK